jgi:hypothetical protein
MSTPTPTPESGVRFSGVGSPEWSRIGFFLKMQGNQKRTFSVYPESRVSALNIQLLILTTLFFTSCVVVSTWSREYQSSSSSSNSSSSSSSLYSSLFLGFTRCDKIFDKFLITLTTFLQLFYNFFTTFLCQIDFSSRDSVTKSIFFTLKLLFFTLELLFFTPELLFFTLELLFFTLELLFYTLESLFFTQEII